MIYFILLVTLIFIVWSEYSVGSILFRPNSSNQISLSLHSLFQFMIHPLFHRTLWTWKTLDINYPFVLGYSIFIYSILNKF